VTAGLVSVIVPFYNAERYLRQAVESVLAQTYRPLELFLVDDASTDGGADIASSMTGTWSEVQLRRLPENQGPAAARNVGLAEVRGDFITFLDADDVMVDDRLALQVGYLTEHPHVDVVLGAEVATIEADAPWELLGRRRSRGSGPHFHIMSMMVRRCAFDRVGGFDPSYRVAEDLDWLFRSSVAGLSVGRIDTILTRHCMHAGNLSYATREIQAGMIRSLRERLHERRRDE
jgi:glycosyltransferase involved in cell wall biosynthesis